MYIPTYFTFWKYWFQIPALKFPYPVSNSGAYFFFFVFSDWTEVEYFKIQDAKNKERALKRESVGAADHKVRQVFIYGAE